MSLKLNDLLKKAKDKGYGINQKVTTLPENSEEPRTWQYESILYLNNKKPDTNATQNGTQTRHKPDTNATQNGTQTRHKLDTKIKVNGTQTRHKLDTNATQTRHKLNKNERFSSLTGLQREIILFLFQECKISMSRITEELSREYIANTLNIRSGSVKTTIIRLEKKGFIKRFSSKEGRGGWSRYEILNHVYSELLEVETRHKRDTNATQTRHKRDTEQYTERYTKPSSSSSNIYINTTTTDLPDEWQKIDNSSLELIGFTASHLLQLYRSGIKEIDTVQDSINYFAYDLTHNGKAKEIKSNPLSYFMGIMKRVGVYAAPENYESEKDRALRIFLENKKANQEKQTKLEEEVMESIYTEWVNKLTDDEKKCIIPESVANGKLEGAKISALKSHFRKNIWPEEKNKINV